MKNREGFINEKELKKTIKLMKENKATDESGMIAEYIKALEGLGFKYSDELAEGCVNGRMHTKGMEEEQSSISVQQERDEKLSTI